MFLAIFCKQTSDRMDTITSCHFSQEKCRVGHFYLVHGKGIVKRTDGYLGIELGKVKDEFNETHIAAINNFVTKFKRIICPRKRVSPSFALPATP